ncbi:MAG: hypothetical protein JXA10_00795 [Anaerolineae bacterium]|nr:hypothetical protein [Anaerolineae bacterium]
MGYIAAGLGMVLIVALGVIGRRALHYVQTHPELVTDGTPLAYQLCQATLQHIITRYKEIAGQHVASAVIAWQAPNGAVYTISRTGIEERRDPNRPPYALSWPDIGGVGVRMQPGFKVLDQDRDGRADSRVTTGYAFHLLIVPVTGDTMTIFIPTNNRTDAVNFVAHTLALAEIMQKRINVFGFNRPPAPHRQRVPRF